MAEAMALNPVRLVIAAIIGLAVLLVLIIKFKIGRASCRERVF